MRTLSYRDYLDRVKGAWAGKCAGGIIGAKSENNKGLLSYTFDTVFPEVIPPNDDFDLQILYMAEVLLKRGFNFTARDLADVFAAKNQCWANEYRVAIRNIECGIYPPASGLFDNDFFKHSNGCPIRSELWALVCPGDPELATVLAEMDGILDHGHESVWVEQFNAALESMAFFAHDLPSLLVGALEWVPKEAKVAEVCRLMLSLRERGVSWQEARAELICRHGSCDASYSVVNAGIVILSLLWGEGNFNDTMLLAVNCGYDTDCSAATAGAILGIICGYEALDPKWKERVGETFVVGTVDAALPEHTLAALSAHTLDLAASLVRDGLTDFEFSDLPEGYLCPIPVYEGTLELEVDYPEGPVLRHDRPTPIRLTLYNNRALPLRASVALELPDRLVATDLPRTLRLRPYREAEIFLSLAVKDGAPPPIENVARLHLTDKDRAHIFRIGVIGEVPYRVHGPFFDLYDTRLFDGDPHEGRMPKDLFSMFGGYADIHRPYLTDDLPTEEGETFYGAGDAVPIEEAVTYRGPCCVYVERSFRTLREEPVSLMVGTNAPFRLYLNGALVAEGDDYVCYTPLNRMIDLTLPMGENRLVCKLLRADGPFRLSLFFSHRTHRDGGVTVDLRPL